MDKAGIYLAKIPKQTEFSIVYPKERNDEINSCTDEKVKKEKYLVWKLLEYALKDTFDFDIKDLKIERTKSGKWVCDKCYFSLSHSKDVLSVAVSFYPVGIDIEEIRSIKENAVIKTLTASEKEKFKRVESKKAHEFLLETWTKKESIFKFCDQEKFLPSKIDTSKEKVFSKKITIDGKEFIISVASENSCDIQIKEIKSI